MSNASNKLYKDKIDDLVETLRQRRSLIVALSGGVDSSLVAALAHRALAQKAQAITIDSPLVPSGDLEDAKRVASEIGIKLTILELNELDIPGFSANPPNRCYLCKRFRFEQLRATAIENDFDTVSDGTNVSDLNEYRPGLKAAEELDVYSPLLEAGLSKEDTRKMAGLMKLPIASKPASPCLATRIPYGQLIELAKIERIEQAEECIRTLTGAKVLRVRDHGNLARIEFGKGEIDLLSNSTLSHYISQSLKQLGYTFVTLDLEGYRSGSFDQEYHSK
ncbi:MAG: ATP-dependent sacrificial sulfur transferase LarE [Dehalococcoidia bacterium]